MAKGFKNAIDQTGIGKGINSLISSTGGDTPKQEKEVAQVTSSGDTRQTFVIDTADLEYLKDYAYEMRLTQKEGLHDAIQALREKAGEMPPRPESVRQKEQDRSQKKK